MNIYYDVEDNHYRTYPDGDIATIDQMRELVENKNLSIVKLRQENKKLNGAIQTFDILLKANVEENKQLKKDYDRIYNENCKLREEHNITDISLLDENYKLKDNWDELKECLKDVMNSSDGDNKDFVETILDIIQELEQGSDNK